MCITRFNSMELPSPQLDSVLNHIKVLTDSYLKINFNIIRPSTPTASKLSLIQDFRIQFCIHVFSFPCAQPSSTVSYSFVWSPNFCMAKSIDHEVLCIVIFSILLLLPLTCPLLYSSITLNICPSLGRETKIHTHTQLQKNYISVYFHFYVSRW
jgi:hypothetical protein